MLIQIVNQQKLDELIEYLRSLPLDVTHAFEGDTFPMVGELRLADGSDIGQLFVSDNGATWETAGEWEKKLEAELHSRFGNLMDTKSI